jgi:hypothetical protein
MAKWLGPCPQCQHTHGTSTCSTCGGGLGYPPGVPVPLVDPCDQCADGIGTQPPVDPEAPPAVVDVQPELSTLSLTDDDWRVEQVIGTGGPLEAPTPQRVEVVADLAPHRATWRKQTAALLDELHRLGERDPGRALDVATQALAFARHQAKLGS